jgi:tRNA pseudouridine55 synthase
MTAETSQSQPRARSKRTQVNGWLILNKSTGMTSTAALNKLKWLLNAKKAGHAGTLDPLATGVLPVALGEATKTVPFAVEARKSYRFTVRWGLATATDDSEGEIVGESDERPTREAIAAALSAFRGLIQQVPPQFSAIKVDGARAYDLARGGEVFALASRDVEVHRLDIIEMPDADHCVLEADCGKGTYVRSIARDLGRELGCFGHISKLERTAVGPFTIAEAVGLDALEAMCAHDDSPTAARAAILPVQSVFSGLPELVVTSTDAARLRRGQPILLRGRDAPAFAGRAFVTTRGMLVAVGDIEQGEFRSSRVFNI